MKTILKDTFIGLCIISLGVFALFGPPYIVYIGFDGAVSFSIFWRIYFMLVIISFTSYSVGRLINGK